jgi:hypothetical protein
MLEERSLAVMAGLGTASRVYPTCGTLIVRNSGKPELRCHPRLSSSTKARRGWPAAQTSLRSLRKLDCVPGHDALAHAEFAARRRAAFVTPIHLSNSPPRSRGAMSAPRFLHPCFTNPDRGVAERRETFGCSGTRAACTYRGTPGA